MLLSDHSVPSDEAVMDQETLATKLEDAICTARAWLLKLDEASVRHRPSAEVWSIAEVMGHLVDSACNNHQRFIRAQDEGGLVFPKYEQRTWVERSNYGNTDWRQLVEFWYLYNQQIARIMRRIPTECLCTSCTIGPYQPCTLDFLLRDYIEHLDHHLSKIRERTSSLGG